MALIVIRTLTTSSENIHTCFRTFWLKHFLGNHSFESAFPHELWHERKRWLRRTLHQKWVLIIYDLCYIQYVKEIVLIMIILIMAISIRFTGADPFFLCLLSFFYISLAHINHLDPNCFWKLTYMYYILICLRFSKIPFGWNGRHTRWKRVVSGGVCAML